MAQKLLHRAQIGAGVEEMCGERVTERVDVEISAAGERAKQRFHG